MMIQHALERHLTQIRLQVSIVCLTVVLRFPLFEYVLSSIFADLRAGRMWSYVQVPDLLSWMPAATTIKGSCTVILNCDIQGHIRCAVRLSPCFRSLHELLCETSAIKFGFNVEFSQPDALAVWKKWGTSLGL